MSKRQSKRQTFKDRFVTAIHASSLLDSPRVRSVPLGAITGILFLIGGLIWLSQSFFLVAHGIPAQGTVSDLSTSRSAENFDVTFLTIHGQRITTSTFTPIDETYQDGTIVPIFYSPTDPSLTAPLPSGSRRGRRRYSAQSSLSSSLQLPMSCSDETYNKGTSSARDQRTWNWNCVSISER